MTSKIIIDQKLLQQIIEEQGPEFEVAIKQSAIENVMRTQIKAIVPNEVRKMIGDLIEAEIKSAVQAELGSVSGDWTPKVTLNQKIVSAVREEAHNAAEDVVRDAIPDARNHAQHLVNSKLSTVDRYIERALVERIGALVDHVLMTHVKLDITTSLLSGLGLGEETEQA